MHSMEVAGLITMFVALLAVQACDDTPPSPEPPTFMWVVDQEDVPGRCEGTPGLAEGFGSGEATHLGRFEITQLDHCSVDIAAFQADLERSVFPFSDDPLFLEKATFPVVLEGRLTLPRPGRGR